jgi:hypothetical protein
MSADNQGTITVTLKSEPFELWFPTLASNESLEVCAATGDWVFASAAETGKGNSPTCLTPGTGVAAGPYGSGYLVLTTPDGPASTNISEDRHFPPRRRLPSWRSGCPRLAAPRLTSPMLAATSGGVGSLSVLTPHQYLRHGSFG